MTTGLRPGYLRKNGYPYSDKTTVTEFYDRTNEANGDSWLIVTTIVNDPVYLNQEFVTSTHFKKQVDEKGWKVVKPYVDDKSNGINYTILHDNVDLTVLYKIQLMPKTVLIDRDGKVAAIHNGIVEKDDFEKEIKTVLGKP